MLHLSKKKIKKLFLKKNQTRKKKQYNNNNNIRNNNKKYKSLKNIKQQRHLNLRLKTLRKKRGGKKSFAAETILKAFSNVILWLARPFSPEFQECANRRESFRWQIR